MPLLNYTEKVISHVATLDDPTWRFEHHFAIKLEPKYSSNAMNIQQKGLELNCGLGYILIALICPAKDLYQNQYKFMTKS